MLRYKSFILPTVSLFFKSKNEIDIFIEDDNDEEFYKSLFSNLVKNKRVCKIFSCKCKTALISACEADQIDSGRKRLYITDGDLDLIFNNNRTELKHLFVLKRYCIENFLLEEEALIEVLHSIVVNDTITIKKELKFEECLRSFSHGLIDLFLHYSITHKHQMGTKTVANNVHSFCVQKSNVSVLDLDKVEQKIQLLRAEIVSIIGVDKYNTEIYDLRQKWPSNIETLTTIVSAKDYIFPLLIIKFKQINGKVAYKLNWESLRVSLAKSCKFKELEILKEKIC